MHSASDQDPTPDIRPAKREIGLWDVSRLLAGLIAGTFFLIGVYKLVILGAQHGDTLLTRNEATDLSSAVTMTVCGLFAAWLAVASQRATDKRAEQRAEVEALFKQQRAITETLVATAKRLDELTAEVHDLIGTEKGQQVHSAKARADVAKICEDMADLRVGVAEMAQRMPSEESLMGHLRAYIDAIFAEFRKRLDEVAEDSDTAGYLRGMNVRVNGTRPHLQAVDTDR